MDPSMSGLSLVKEELLQKHAVLPLFKRGGKLFVRTADPTNTHALDEIKFHTNLVVEPILVDEDAIRINLERWLQAEIGRHTSELQSLMRISYAVFCLKKLHNLTTTQLSIPT